MSRFFPHPSLFFLLVAVLTGAVFGQDVVPSVQATPMGLSVVPAVYSGHASAQPIQQVQFQESTEPFPFRLQPPVVQPAFDSENVAPIGRPSFVAPNPGFIAPGSRPPVPLAQSAASHRPIASEAVFKNHRLQNISAQTLESRLLEKLGNRFVPVKNVETPPNLARFRLPVKDGTDIELTIDRQNDTATVLGSAPMVDAVVRLVGLLDVPEGGGTVTTEIVPVQRTNIVPVKQATETIVRETQREPQRAPTPNIQDLVPQGGGAIVGPIQIDVVEGLDVMVIRGSKDEVAQILEMLNQIEAISLENEPLIELVDLKHADSYRVGQMVQQLYQQVYQARRGSITMLPLVKPNTILLIGKKESIDTAKELIAKLDTPVAPQSQFLVIRLKNASSDAVQTYLTNFYGNRLNLGAQVLAVSDPRTNALIIQANPRDLAEAAALVKQLDSEGSEAVNTIKTFQLRNALAMELATVLQNAIAGTAVGTGLAGTGAQAAGRTRTPSLQIGTVDADGNLLTANVLFDVRITAHTASNTLIVSAPTETMPLIEALIQELDQLPSAESQIKVFTIANGDAMTLTSVLQTLFSPSTAAGAGLGAAAQTSQIATVRPGIDEDESTLVSVRFATDIRTNSIIASGSAGDLSVVEAILLRLDEENTTNRKVMLFKLVNKPADQLAPVLQQYITGERQLEIQNSGMYYPQSPAEQYRKEVVIVPEPLSNSLIVSATPQYVEQIRKLVQQLDERPLMVAIQVLIAEVRLNKNREFGIELGLQDSLLFDRSLLSAGGAPSPGFLFGDPTLGLPLGPVSPGTVGSQGITSLGVGRSGSSAGVGGFTFSASSESLSILLRALETDSRVRILSRPQMTTLHNIRGTVQVGQRVPYVTGTNTQIGGTTSNSTEYHDVGVILDVTPRVTPDNMITMNVYAERSTVGSLTDGIPIGSAGNVPLISPKINLTMAQTTVSAMDGQTIVLAGLITEQKETVHRSVPFLNKIPVVKHLFEYKANSTDRSEMLIVLTPTIIRNEMEMELLKQQEASRMHWCLSDVLKLTGNSNMRLRTDDWSDHRSVPIIHGAPVILDDSDLPSEEKIRRELPMPVLAPREN